VEDARALKPGLLHLVDRVLLVYTPTVLAVAAVSVVVWLIGSWLVAGQADVARAVFAGLSVLVMGYPCAVGISAPLSIVRGAGEAADNGILMRTGEAFQAFRLVRQIMLDKTGTVTEGRMELSDVALLDGSTRTEVLRLAGAVETASEHPIAEAVASAARAEIGELPPVTGFRNEPGVGVRGVVEGRDVVVGRRDGRIEVGWDGLPRAILTVRETIKPSSGEAVRQLRGLGLTPVLLTGDSRDAAEHVAREVGIERVVAEVLPADKAAEVARLQSQGHAVAMVGEGVNDAPALAQADLGLAIGTGTDVAIEASDLTLVSGDLRAASDAIRLARRTLRTIEGNLFWAFAYNVAAIPLAIAGLLDPIVAAAAMACSSLFVVTNSLRLRRFESSR
jgi:Cu+-exporting ATPase